MADPIDLRVLLDEDDFRSLVSGGVVQVGMKIRGAPAVMQVALKDIGWDRMTAALRDAIEGHAVTRPFASADEFFEGMQAAGGGEGGDDGAQAAG